MAERRPQKITIFLLLTALLLAPAWAKETFEPGTIRPEELRAAEKRGGTFLVLDARAKEEFERERLPGAKLPYEKAYYQDLEMFRQKIVREAPRSKESLERATKDLPRATPIVTYCRDHCGLSKTLKLDLEGLGFTNVRWLEGGIDVWREKGYPLEKR